MPEVARWIAQALPLTHAVAIARPLALGHVADVPLASIAYLLVAAVVLPAVSLSWMRRKLIV
jgi:lipooligosaccharide transport system permease protein